jgi:transcriptional antiterminator RfaH
MDWLPVKAAKSTVFSKRAKAIFMRHWHLLMTKPREDERAEQHLLNQGYEIFRPLLKRYSIKGGKQVPVTEPLFPRYIFINLDDVLSNWSKLRSTRGVAKLVKFTDMPAIVPQVLIDGLKCKCGDSGILDTTEEKPFVYSGGDSVEVITGSFKGTQAIIKEQKGEDRVLLLLSLLGKEQTVEIPISQVRSIS